MRLGDQIKSLFIRIALKGGELEREWCEVIMDVVNVMS